MLPPLRTEQLQHLRGKKWSLCAQAQELDPVLQRMPHRCSRIIAEKELKVPAKPGLSAQV